MDLKTISATLAILGTGLTLSACKKAPAEGTEVPGDKAGGAEGSCGADKGHGHANCSGDKAAEEKPAEGSCSGEKRADGSCSGEKKADGSCGGAKGEGSCGGAKTETPPPTTADASAASPTATETAPAATAAKPAETTTKAKPKTKSGKPKAKGGEASCGEGTCA
jgi:hypothetical protein